MAQSSAPSCSSKASNALVAGAPQPVSPDAYVGRICDVWRHNLQVILFPEDAIAKRVAEMGAQITKDYAGKRVLAVGLLSGAFVFLADLLRHVGLQYDVDFMVVSSYGSGTTSSGNVKVKKDIGIDPAGKHILLIEDLIDTGHTLKWVKKHLQSKDCASIKIACLLDKKARREAEVDIDYVGFTCPNEFVVGYGMDFDNEYRCLPFIGVLKPEAYAHLKH